MKPRGRGKVAPPNASPGHSSSRYPRTVPVRGCAAVALIKTGRRHPAEEPAEVLYRAGFPVLRPFERVGQRGKGLDRRLTSPMTANWKTPSIVDGAEPFYLNTRSPHRFCRPRTGARSHPRIAFLSEIDQAAPADVSSASSSPPLSVPATAACSRLCFYKPYFSRASPAILWGCLPAATKSCAVSCIWNLLCYDD
jgi:hypothetical protein